MFLSTLRRSKTLVWSCKGRRTGSHLFARNTSQMNLKCWKTRGISQTNIFSNRFSLDMRHNLREFSSSPPSKQITSPQKPPPSIFPFWTRVGIWVSVALFSGYAFWYWNCKHSTFLECCLDHSIQMISHEKNLEEEGVPTEKEGVSYLRYHGEELPKRNGERPETYIGWPHIQLSQSPNEKFSSLIQKEVLSLRIFNGDVSGRKSKFEVYSTGLFFVGEGQGDKEGEEFQEEKEQEERKFEGTLRKWVKVLPWNRAKEVGDHRVGGIEFAHSHLYKEDTGSWHIKLSTQDAHQVVEKGWGEFFPTLPLSLIHTENLVLVYAPRDLKEAEVFRAILMAAYLNAKVS